MSVLQKTIIGLDFPDFSAELAEIQMHGKNIYLKSFNRLIIPSSVMENGEIKNEEELKKILTTLLQTANPAPVETKNVSILLPSNKVITHVFTFPTNLSEKDIAKSIIFQAETVIPYAIEDVYYDYVIINKKEAKETHAYQQVLFSCITKDIADKYTNLLESIDLVPQLCSVNVEALKHSIAEGIKEPGVSLIMDVDTLSVNYLLSENGIIKHFFSTNNGGVRLVNSIASELNKTTDEIIQLIETQNYEQILTASNYKELIEKNYLRGQKIIEEQVSTGKTLKVDNVVLTGKFLNFPGFNQLAKQYFANQKILIGDPKNSITIDDKMFIPTENQGNQYVPFSIFFTNSIGVGLQGICDKFGKCEGINLLPDRLKESFVNKKKAIFTAILSITMTVISVIIASLLYYTHLQLNFERIHLEIQKQGIEKIIYSTRYQEIKDEIIEFNTELVGLIQIDQTLYSVPSAITLVTDLIPEGVELTKLKFNHDDISVEINGIAKDRDVLLEAQKQFEQADFVDDILSPISNYDEKTKISFNMKIYLIKPKLPKYGHTDDI